MLALKAFLKQEFQASKEGKPTKRFCFASFQIDDNFKNFFTYSTKPDFKRWQLNGYL